MKQFAILILIFTAVQCQAQTLVAYFSATGTTQKVAEDISRIGGYTLWEIAAYEPYTADDLNWRNKQSRSSLEMADPNERPTVRACTDITPYDTIYVGFPIWWGICPRIIQSWVENNELEGKTLIPFATSGSSGIGKAVAFLRETYPQYNWQDGLLLNEYTEESLRAMLKR